MFLSVIVALRCNHALIERQIANKRDKTKIIVLPELNAHHIHYDFLLVSGVSGNLFYEKGWRAGIM